MARIPIRPRRGSRRTGTHSTRRSITATTRLRKLLLERGAYPNPPVESSADAVWIAIRGGDIRMLELLASHGAVWEIPLALDGTLTYDRIVATGIQRTLGVLAYYGDTASAEPLLAANPELADDAQVLSYSRGSRAVRPPPASVSTRPCKEGND